MTIQLIENKSEIGAGTRGASLGIDALRIAGLNRNNNYFSNHDVITIKDNNNLLFRSLN